MHPVSRRRVNDFLTLSSVGSVLPCFTFHCHKNCWRLHVWSAAHGARIIRAIWWSRYSKGCGGWEGWAERRYRRRILCWRRQVRDFGRWESIQGKAQGSRWNCFWTRQRSWLYLDLQREISGPTISVAPDAPGETRWRSLPAVEKAWFVVHFLLWALEGISCCHRGSALPRKYREGSWQNSNLWSHRWRVRLSRYRCWRKEGQDHWTKENLRNEDRQKWSIRNLRLTAR